MRQDQNTYEVEIHHADGGRETITLQAWDEDHAFELATVRALELCGGVAREIIVSEAA